MGTFARLLKEDGAKIPEDKREEFKERVEQLFCAGGMMEMNTIKLCGKKVFTINPAIMREDGMDFYYNYYEDSCWENAGFSQKYFHVYSEKIGWNRFKLVVAAAYLLEEQYLDGQAVPMVDNDFVISSKVMGWLLYLFPDLALPRHKDPWGIFEMIYEEVKEYGQFLYKYLQRYNWNAFSYDMCSALGVQEINAVIYGTDKVLPFNHRMESVGMEDVQDENPYYALINFREKVIKYKEDNERDEAEQLSLVMDILHTYYEQDDDWTAICKKYDDTALHEILFHAAASDAPAFTVKIIAEIYEKDFWELWNPVKDIAGRKNIQTTTWEICPVTTAEYLDINPDDMILFWKDDDKIEFSESLWEWFKDLRNKYDNYKEMKFCIKKPLIWILELMEYAEENYHNIFAIDSFFQETIEHLNDRRYHILWKLYDDMLYDPEMEEAGSVIFEHDKSEQRVDGTHSQVKQSRCLITLWELMNRDLKFNKARTTFRRYMALVANQELRKQVFGF